ncbi:MAG: glycosyltransferase [Candidatus Omnitrophota bacterium]|nr:glycosyltransferase [Candidatus Omnitrophota bacterium]
MKVALVHDWMIHMRGGEKVLEALAEIYPQATLYTLFYDREKLSPALRNRKIVASFLQKLPGIKRYYRWLLPILPKCIESLRVADVDLVVSTSHCVAKGVRVPLGARHICYCHTPMRYLWDLGDVYFKNIPGFLRPILNAVLVRLRDWDRAVNVRVDQFVSNSAFVEERIRRHYGRDAVVVHPPVRSDYLKPQGEKRDFYLVVSAFVPYKRVDVVIEAFNEIERDLVIVGGGPLERSYKALAKSPRISFLGSVDDERLRSLYSEARAVIFPTEEDFGIVPVEAQACGTPVIALDRGGALEGVKSGIFIDDQTPAAVRAGVERFEKMTFQPTEVRERISGFSKEEFKGKMIGVINSVVNPAGAYVTA